MATILIADDSTTIRKVVQSVLGAAGHTVVGATQGREALELARGRRPDLVLCDVLMPELTGYEVAEALRRDPALRGVPIVLLFGAFEPFDEDRAARCGASGHLAKPFEPRQLLRRVEELLLASPPAPSPGPTRDAPAAAEPAPPPEEFSDAPLDLPPPWDARVPLPGDDEFDLVPAPPEAAPAPDLEAAIREEVRRRLEELAPEIVREVAWEVVPDLLERLLRESAAAPRRPAEPTGDATR